MIVKCSSHNRSVEPQPCVSPFYRLTYPIMKALARLPLSYQLPRDFFYLPNQFWKHKNQRRRDRSSQHISKQKGYDLVVAASGKAEDHRHSRHYETLQSLVFIHLAWQITFVSLEWCRGNMFLL